MILEHKMTDETNFNESTWLFRRINARHDAGRALRCLPLEIKALGSYFL